MLGKEFEAITSCVACNESNLIEVLNLGFQPLANDFLEFPASFEEYPLKLMRCLECSHAQLSVSVSPSRLFRNYSYVSATSTTLDSYFNSLSAYIKDEFDGKGKILDIGSNDGSFLQKFKDSKWEMIGVDPAINLVSISAASGIPTLPAFFTRSVANLLASDFDVIVAMNILAHTPDPLEILLGMKSCLKENGKILIQTSQANMFISGEFDTIYHEHISFFNVKSMKAIVERAGLHLSKVKIVSVHGGSYLWELKKNQSFHVVHERELFEDNMGFGNQEFYDKFSRLAKDRSLEINSIVKNFRESNYKIVSYGAAAKGNTFLNYSRINLDYIFDDTPQKIGKHSPAGSCIVSNPGLLSDINSPVLVICPAWNFKEEIFAKVKALRLNPKDKFLTYFPDLNLININ